jgi:HEAT repeat protein
MNFATSGFSFLVALLLVLGALQVAYFVVSGGLKGTRYYYRARIHDANPAVRASVIRALAARGDAMALEFLLQAVGDAEPNNRLTAIEGMRRYSDPAVQDALIKLAADPHAVVRRAATAALGRFQSPQSIETLTKRLTDTVPAVQIAAIQGLKVAQEPSTIEAIARTLSSPDKDVVRQAQEALLPFGIPVIDRLGAMLPEVGAAAPAFVRIMTQLDRELACQAIAKVLPAMRHTQAITEALQLLVRNQQPGLVTLLAQLLDVPDYPSHELVIHSFVKLHDPDSIVPLCRHLSSSRFRGSVIAVLETLAPVFGREMIPPLSEAMRDPDRAVRKAASHLLGKVGGSFMVDAALIMLWGEHAAARRAFLERHLGYTVHRLVTYHEAALSLDRLMTSTMGEEGLRAIDELESLMIMIYGDALRGVLINENPQLILKDRRTLYPVRPDHLNPLAADLLDFAANMAEGDRFRLTTS